MTELAMPPVEPADATGASGAGAIGVLVRVIEQAVRDGIIKVNPARVTGWQKLYKQAARPTG